MDRRPFRKAEALTTHWGRVTYCPQWQQPTALDIGGGGRGRGVCDGLTDRRKNHCPAGTLLKPDLAQVSWKCGKKEARSKRGAGGIACESCAYFFEKKKVRERQRRSGDAHGIAAYLEKCLEGIFRKKFWAAGDPRGAPIITQTEHTELMGGGVLHH